MTAPSKLTMFENRLVKVFRHLRKTARRQEITCYRVYDDDIPEFPFSIEIYEQCVYVAEYQRRHGMTEEEHEEWLESCVEVISRILEIPSENIFIKQRQRKQNRQAQYEKLSFEKHEMTVHEAGLKFKVNLSDYLDTGLFLDHRITRGLVRDEAKDKQVLNLFCYTGSATVYAKDAAQTTSVDLSNTYLAWAEENFALNKLDPRRHRVVKDDCLHWMEAAIASGARYDVIFLAPPTFSNSKGMDETLDLQRDHTAMLASCEQLLAKDGLLYFVNHFRRFKMQAPDGLAYEELTKRTLPPDFQRDARFHNAWLLRRR